MRSVWLFILVACSGPAPREPVRVPLAVVPDAAVDAAPDAPPPPALRGEACGTCADGLTCDELPGGYCASACDSCGDGACVASARSAPRCMKKCDADAECRTSEGYRCDPAWHACVLPNLAVIVPGACPATAKAVAGVPVEVGSGRDPSAVVLDNGDVVAAFGGAALIDARGVQPLEVHAQQIARDAKGILYATWLVVEGAHHEILLARSRDSGKTWAAPDRVDACEEADCLDAPQLAVGNDLVFVIYAAGGGIRVATSHDEGATFRAPVTAMSGHHGSAVVGSDGRLHVVALDPGISVPGFGSADARVMYTVSADAGVTFEKPQRLSGRDELVPFYGSAPQIALGRGVIYTAYVRGGRDAVWDLVVASTKDKGKTWKRTALGDGCTTHAAPSLAVDAAGLLHLGWLEQRGFMHATCGATCVERGAFATFPGFNLERGTDRALGDRTALVYDAKRKLLHALWTEPGGRVRQLVAPK